MKTIVIVGRLEKVSYSPYFKTLHFNFDGNYEGQKIKGLRVKSIKKNNSYIKTPRKGRDCIATIENPIIRGGILRGIITKIRTLDELKK